MNWRDGMSMYHLVQCVENDKINLLWDINVQCDHVMEARRPDIILVDKENKVCPIIVVAIPGDIRVRKKQKRLKDARTSGGKLQRYGR